jgi:hypothetical protein
VDCLPYQVPGLTLVAEGIDGTSRGGSDSGTDANLESVRIFSPAVDNGLWPTVSRVAEAVGWRRCQCTMDAASESNARAFVSGVGSTSRARKLSTRCVYPTGRRVTVQSAGVRNMRCSTSFPPLLLSGLRWKRFAWIAPCAPRRAGLASRSDSLSWRSTGTSCARRGIMIPQPTTPAHDTPRVTSSRDRNLSSTVYRDIGGPSPPPRGPRRSRRVGEGFARRSRRREKKYPPPPPSTTRATTQLATADTCGFARAVPCAGDTPGSCVAPCLPLWICLTSPQTNCLI